MRLSRKSAAALDASGQTLAVVAMNPVAKDLPVHPAMTPLHRASAHRLRT
jgi:hypothetical protein